MSYGKLFQHGPHTAGEIVSGSQGFDRIHDFVCVVVQQDTVCVRSPCVDPQEKAAVLVRCSVQFTSPYLRLLDDVAGLVYHDGE